MIFLSWGGRTVPGELYGNFLLVSGTGARPTFLDGRDRVQERWDGSLPTNREDTAMSTKERLAKAMEAAGCSVELIARARGGEFDDFESPSATPITRLVRVLVAEGFSGLANRAMNGEFDSTKEEAEAWGRREGHRLIGEF